MSEQYSKRSRQNQRNRKAFESALSFAYSDEAIPQETNTKPKNKSGKRLATKKQGADKAQGSNRSFMFPLRRPSYIATVASRSERKAERAIDDIFIDKQCYGLKPLSLWTEHARNMIINGNGDEVDADNLDYMMEQVRSEAEFVGSPEYRNRILLQCLGAKTISQIARGDDLDKIAHSVSDGYRQMFEEMSNQDAPHMEGIKFETAVGYTATRTFSNQISVALPATTVEDTGSAPGGLKIGQDQPWDSWDFSVLRIMDTTSGAPLIGRTAERLDCKTSKNGGVTKKSNAGVTIIRPATMGMASAVDFDQIGLLFKQELDTQDEREAAIEGMKQTWIPNIVSRTC